MRSPREELVRALAEPRAGNEEMREDALDYQSQTFTSRAPNHQPDSRRKFVRESAEWNVDVPEDDKVSSEDFKRSKETTQLSFRENLSYTPDTTSDTFQTSPIYSQSVLSLEDNEISLPAGWRLAGYLHNTYYLFETGEGFEIIEQHIAHERYLYEKILQEQETPGRINEHNQRLLISAPLDLSASQIDIIKSNLDELQSLGFDFDFEGDEKVSATQVPMQLAHQNYSSIVQTMIEDLKDSDKANIALDATKSIACQAAIKNGMHLSEGDILKLVSAWLKTERNDTCPHGRPIRLKFSKKKLFEMFHPA